MAGDERRADDVGLAQLLEQLLDDLAAAPAGLPADAVLLGERAQFLDRLRRMHLAPDLGRHRVDHAHPRPRLGEVDSTRRRSSTTLDAGRVERGLGDQHLGDVDHVVPVAERLVELHHRELGVVPRRHALVAEDPADLEHPLHAADDQPLEVQFERDAQVQLHVERVVVGDERPGVGAAGLDVQHRRLDLDEAALVQRAAEAGDDRVADLEGPPRLVVDDQVGVALAEPGVGVGQAVPLVGHRPHAPSPAVRPARSSPTARPCGWSSRCRRRRPSRRGRARLIAANASSPIDGLRDEQLDLAGAVAQRGEDQLARVAQQHHPPGDADPVVGLGARLQVAPRGAHLARGRACGRTGTGTGWRRRRASPSTRSSRRAFSAARPLPVRGRSACRARRSRCHRSRWQHGSEFSPPRRIRVPGSSRCAVDRPPAPSTLYDRAVLRATSAVVLLLGACPCSRCTPSRSSPTRPIDRSGATATAAAGATAPLATDIVTVNNSGELTPANASAPRSPRPAQAGAAAAIGRSASVGMTDVRAGAHRRPGRRRPASPTRWAPPCCRSSSSASTMGRVDLGHCSRRRRRDGPADRRPARRRRRRHRSPRRGDRGASTPFTVARRRRRRDARRHRAADVAGRGRPARASSQISQVVIWNSSRREPRSTPRCPPTGSVEHQGPHPPELGSVRPRLTRSAWRGPRRVLGEFAYRVNRERLGDARPGVDEHVHHRTAASSGLRLSSGCHRTTSRPALQAAMNEVVAAGLAGTINFANANTCRRLLRAAVQPADARLVGRVPVAAHVGPGARHQHASARARAARRRTWTAGSCGSSASTASRGVATS